MSKSILLFPIVVLASVGALLGCGGGGQSTADPHTSASSAPTSGSSAGEGPLTRARYIKLGDAICEKAHSTIYNEGRKYRDVHAKELSRISPVAGEEKLIRLIVLPNVVEEAEGLEALGPLKGEEKTIKSLIAGVKRAVSKAKKNPNAIEGEFGYGVNPFQGIDVRFREYGFNTCSILT